MRKFIILVSIPIFCCWMISGLNGKPLVINGKIRNQLMQIGSSIGAHNKLDAMTAQKWKSLIREIHQSGAGYDINKLIQIVLKEVKKETGDNLLYLTLKVKYVDSLKKEIRQYINDLRGYQSQFQGEPVMIGLKDYSPSVNFALQLRGASEYSAQDLTRLKGGCCAVSVVNSPVQSVNELNNLISQCEGKLPVLDEILQLSNLDLQKFLQTQRKMDRQLTIVAKELNRIARDAIR